MRKEPTKSGAEIDWVCNAPYVGKPRKVGRIVKRAMNKRARRRGKRIIGEA